MSENRKSVALELNGQVHRLRLTWNAMIELCEKWGVQLEKLGEELDTRLKQGNTLGNMRTLVWAALLHEDESLDEKTVGSWIDFSDTENVMSALSDVIALNSQTETGKAEAGQASP